MHLTGERRIVDPKVRIAWAARTLLVAHSPLLIDLLGFVLPFAEVACRVGDSDHSTNGSYGDRLSALSSRWGCVPTHPLGRMARTSRHGYSLLNGGVLSLSTFRASTHWVTVVAAVAVLAVACATDQSPRARADVVPWIDKPSEPYPETTTTPALPSVPPCRADQLAAHYRGIEGALGHVGVFLGVANASSTECALQGMPLVRLVTTEGETLPLRQEGGVYFSDNGPERVALEPGLGLPADPTAELRPGQALIAFEWLACPPQPRIAEILLSPSGEEGTITIPIGSGGIMTSGFPMCEQGETVEPWLAVGNFQNIQPPPEIPAYTKLIGTINAPPIAVAGQQLRYEVTLRNPTPEDIPFDVCPSYGEWIGAPTGVKRPIKVTGRYRLNCAAAPLIGARRSVTFEMILLVPAGTPSTDVLLWWDLEPPSLEQAPSPVPIRIRSA